MWYIHIVVLIWLLLGKNYILSYRSGLTSIWLIVSYGLPKETVVAIMMLYKNTKVKVCSLDGNTDYFDIVAGVLHGDTLAPYLFIICLDYMHIYIYYIYIYIYIYIHLISNKELISWNVLLTASNVWRKGPVVKTIFGINDIYTVQI